MTQAGALYNENEPYAVEWLQNLERAGHIAAGAIDPRSIRAIAASDLRGRRQAHFFAGLGGWSHALRLADWPDDAPVWTGSCPCQPFSQSGRKKGFADDRHLWPTWFKLIEECRPPIIFGEQVASPDGLKWLDLVLTDLEGAGYAFGTSDLCAAGIGAPHIRQRLYFVAVANDERCKGQRLHLRAGQSRSPIAQVARGGTAGTLANASGHERGEGRRRPAVEGRTEPRGTSEQSSGCRDDSAWSAADYLPCTDGKARPVEPGTFPLAHGVPARVGKLRAYGNAIVPQVAATFIRAARSAMIEVQP
jgi:DNA (cytosine-5)-methyltransferase 1